MNNTIQVTTDQQAQTLISEFEKCHRGASQIISRRFVVLNGIYLIARYNKKQELLIIKF